MPAGRLSLSVGSRVRNVIVLAVLAAGACSQQPAKAPAGRSFPASPNLNFEDAGVGALPASWTAGGTRDAFELSLDRDVRHTGAASGRIRALRDPGTAFGSMKSCVNPSRFAGKTATLRGYLKTQDATRRAFLYLRLDGADTPFLVNSQDTPVTGTTDWTERVVTGRVPPGGTQLCAGFLLEGTGTAWADDFTLDA